MAEDKITIQKIFDEDKLKEIAGKIVSGEIDNLILIYRDKESNSIRWATTIKDWVVVFGSMKMTDEIMRQEWLGWDKDEGEE